MSSRNLAALPPDIIRRIVQMDQDSMESMRLIAPSWNTAIVAYLKEPRNLLPLERVYLITDDAEERRNEKSRYIRMYAILPDQCARRVGVGKWLTTHANFDRALEVTCEPQNLKPGLFAEFKPFGKRMPRQARRFARFFSSFSHIETLVLDNISNLDLLRHATATLGQMIIVKLEVRAANLDQNMQERIVKLIRKHGIRHISIIASTCDVPRIRKFMIDTVHLGASLNLYEPFAPILSSATIFSQTYEFWDTFMANLKREGVTLEKHHEFAKRQEGIRTRTKFSCYPTDAEGGHSDNPTRGYEQEEGGSNETCTVQ